jgi:hypothetical protein
MPVKIGFQEVVDSEHGPVTLPWRLRLIVDVELDVELAGKDVLLKCWQPDDPKGVPQEFDELSAKKSDIKTWHPTISHEQVAQFLRDAQQKLDSLISSGPICSCADCTPCRDAHSRRTTSK